MPLDPRLFFPVPSVAPACVRCGHMPGACYCRPTRAHKRHWAVLALGIGLIVALFL